MKRLSEFGLRRQAGVTILEFIAFIGLAALVIAGALGLYNSASTGSSANDVIQAANGMVATLRQTYATSSVSDWRTAANSVSSSVPNGWSGWDKTGKSSRGGVDITITGTSLMNVAVQVSKKNVCDQVKGSTVGGAKTSGTCNADGTASTLNFQNIQP